MPSDPITLSKKAVPPAEACPFCEERTGEKPTQITTFLCNPCWDFQDQQEMDRETPSVKSDPSIWALNQSSRILLDCDHSKTIEYKIAEALDAARLDGVRAGRTPLGTSRGSPTSR